MSRIVSVIVAAVVAALVVPATIAAPAGAQTGDLDAFCAARVAINGAETKKQNLAGLNKLVSVAPAEVAAEMTELRNLFKKKGFDAYESDLVGTVDRYVYDNCPGTQVEVTAVDYEFQNVPATLPAGPTNFKLVNEAPEEAHEMGIVRLSPKGEGMDVEKILSLPEKKQAKLLDFSSATGMYAEAGATGYTLTDLQPGTYAYACFINVGGKKKGAPHFTKGMYGSFTVQ